MMTSIASDHSVFTFEDAVSRLLGYCNLNGQTNAVEAIHQAVLGVYDDIVNERNWSYLNRHWRVPLVAPETGTCSYSATTGEFTIDSGTWPTWAERAFVQIGDVLHMVKTRTSGTVLAADDNVRPIDDIATGTSFTIFKSIYQLPWDCRRVYRPLDETADSWAHQIEFSQWLELVRYQSAEGAPWAFCVAPDPYEPVRMALLIQPYADTERTLDVAYQRYPRPLLYNGTDGHCRDGTITAAGTAVTGSGTAFESGMVGALLRVSRSPTTAYPKGRGSINAYKQQTYIKSYSSATSITLHESLTVTAGKYTISDPLDLDRPLMDAFWRGCEWKLAQSLRFPNVKIAEDDFNNAMRKARGSDQKTSVSRSSWDRGGRLRPMGGYINTINTDPNPDD